MGAWQYNTLTAERADLKKALEDFFGYITHSCAAAGDPPPQVQAAFGIIVDYYTQRLKNFVKLFPREYLNRIYDSRDLFYHAWGALWRNGHCITQRTPAGVCAWLKRVIRNHKLDMRRKHQRLDPLGWSSAEEIDARLHQTAGILSSLGLLPDHYGDDEIFYRHALLCELMNVALATLKSREQRVIQLSRAQNSLDEIVRAMGFTSRRAASSFKKRAYEKLAQRLLLLFRRELNRAAADLRRKGVLEEWVARFHRRGMKKRALILRP